jgi:hypothetical protein
VPLIPLRSTTEEHDQQQQPQPPQPQPQPQQTDDVEKRLILRQGKRERYIARVYEKEKGQQRLVRNNNMSLNAWDYLTYSPTSLIFD